MGKLKPRIFKVEGANVWFCGRRNAYGWAGNYGPCPKSAYDFFLQDERARWLVWVG